MKRKDIDNLKRISSYNYENIFNVELTEDGNYYYNLYNSVFVGEIDAGLYNEHSFSEGEFWANLAKRYYGEPKLWWVIAIANQVQNPLDLPEPGTKLKILKDFVVSDILSQILNARD